jgi:hypothetical protein
VKKKGLSYTEIFSTYSRFYPELLYGRENDLRELLSFLRGNATLFFLKGTRRVGKSSTLLTLLKIISFEKYKRIYDVKGNWIPIYISLDMIKDLQGLTVNLLPIPKIGMFRRKKFNYKTWRDLKNSTRYPLYVKKFLNIILENFTNTRSFGIGIEGLSFSSDIGVEKIVEPKITLKILEDAAITSKSKIALVIDEAQRAYSWAQDFIQFLKTINDEYQETFKVMITGSLVRPVEMLVSHKYESELHGREIITYKLREITVEDSIKMLKEGFDSAEAKYDDWVISSAINLTYRIPGWLALLGKNYVESKESDVKKRIIDAITKSYKEVGKSIREEINTIKRIKKDQYYYNAIQTILKKKEVKPYDLSNELKCDIKEAKKILNKLEEMDFVLREENNIYKLNDPTLITLYKEFKFNEEACPICGKGKALVGNIKYLVRFDCGHLIW